MRLSLVLSFITAETLVAAAPAAGKCKAVFGKTGWPEITAWNALRSQVGGNLVSVVPPGAYCRSTFEGEQIFNATKCRAYGAGIQTQEFSFHDPVHLLYTWFSDTCMPGTNLTVPCTFGNYPRRVLNARNAADVQAGVNFARANNVRLVIKNTGHDFLGKSLGAHSLSIRTHNLKTFEPIQSYAGPGGYRGSAIKLGAGWQHGDLYEALDRIDKVTPGGECAGVGYSGGYIQGGGHGPLTSLYGLASDQALNFEIVTADGKLVNANTEENPDLFWALRGGGASTWGIVTSVTVKTYDTPKTSGSVFTDFSDRFKALEAFHAASPHLTDHGLYGYYEMNSTFFEIRPLLAPGKSTQQFDSILQPFEDALKTGGITYKKNTTEHPSFLAAYLALFETEKVAFTMISGSRLIHRQHVLANNSAITEIFKKATDSKLYFVGHMFAPSAPATGAGFKVGETGANPAWSDTVLFPMIQGITQLTGTGKERTLDAVVRMQELFEGVTPASGTYLNEGNAFDANWQQGFYGSNYAKLKGVKRKYDPEGVFYAKTAVRSEEWEEREDLQLCRV